MLVANLQPAKIMGVESQGMLLAAGAEEVLELATFSKRSRRGRGLSKSSDIHYISCNLRSNAPIFV